MGLFDSKEFKPMNETGQIRVETSSRSQNWARNLDAVRKKAVSQTSEQPTNQDKRRIQISVHILYYD
ncbi:hypothetical protein CHS0354_038044 [Potamilus streckersoni]|uniref:Uncharacterized protein n=1 Tax=Potamilus streckersoni TaxID=2493646 RepID=A0AAE0SS53_9BIVA|nr:hypothetical protein CHS0354_038044 [Potamilus streckersoni]